jgi:hypothetical protein
MKNYLLSLGVNWIGVNDNYKSKINQFEDDNANKKFYSRQSVTGIKRSTRFFKGINRLKLATSYQKDRKHLKNRTRKHTRNLRQCRIDLSVKI